MTNLIGIISLGTLNEQWLVALSGYGLPIVMIDHEDKLMRADSIFMDNRNGIERITDHLIGLGHRKLTFVGELKHSRSFFDRWIGFRTVIENADLEHESVLMDITYDDDMEVEIQRKFDKWKKEKIPFPTAFVCANDHIARRVIHLLEDNGLTCPQDVSVTGFDLLAEEEGRTPALTTVQVLKQVIGRRAVDRLVWRINHNEYPPEKILISGDMLLKESVDIPRDR
ncbi:substrate-binding domain-containing protein [Alkalicoccobacillus plakortidis]|uniref:Substrate-binding domain-containing protein n=1 Tax=Alkalicoccobacillus plakortidis TaxID=444060 RepID=A0ABT0XI79_9BACI|nr:substrate-binding domain-containing protein [Alkalicoccobacillus plakortidis]MCM2675621.1 substrate-binding domain-containing protein [Alkalicoccobacillus plakortidis]